jgi:mannitol-1-phosphate/altronate dehydrogenase
MLRKQNVCTTLSFISVLITAIGYCGDQSDNEENEQQQKTPEVVSDIPEVVRHRIFFSLTRISSNLVMLRFTRS